VGGNSEFFPLVPGSTLFESALTLPGPCILGAGRSALHPPTQFPSNKIVFLDHLLNSSGEGWFLPLLGILSFSLPSFLLVVFKEIHPHTLPTDYQTQSEPSFCGVGGACEKKRFF